MTTEPILPTGKEIENLARILCKYSGDTSINWTSYVFMADEVLKESYTRTEPKQELVPLDEKELRNFIHANAMRGTGFEIPFGFHNADDVDTLTKSICSKFGTREVLSEEEILDILNRCGAVYENSAETLLKYRERTAQTIHQAMKEKV